MPWSVITRHGNMPNPAKTQLLPRLSAWAPPSPPASGRRGAKSAGNTPRSKCVHTLLRKREFRGSPPRPCRAPSGDNIGQQLALDLGDLVFEQQLSLF